MRVYLSSSFAACEDRTDSLIGLRKDLQALGERRLGVEVILAEDDCAVKKAIGRDDAPGILEGCARLMGEADALFGLLFERHGTEVTLQQTPVEIRAHISFFEAELLEASMTRKPICIAQVRGFEPSKPFGEFLRLVSGTLGPAVVPVDRQSIPELFASFCHGLKEIQERETPWLFDVVSIARVRHSSRSEAQDPALTFLGGAFGLDSDGTPDAGILEAALHRVKLGKASDGSPLGQLEKLSYLWVAVRELARGARVERTADFGDETLQTLELWNSAAAWYGLHGSHPMGCLATLNELTRVKTLRGGGELPYVARSSAYYSVGTKLRERGHARQFFRHSLYLATAGLGMKPPDPSGHLQMTASANSRLALLGERWRYFLALHDFRKSLEWRSRHGASNMSVGEAMSAYGHALFELPWRRREAIRLAEEGSQLMRASPDGTSSGFYFRAERKRAEMLRRQGLLDEALAVATQAARLARETQAFDQSSPLETLAVEIAASL